MSYNNYPTNPFNQEALIQQGNDEENGSNVNGNGNGNGGGNDNNQNLVTNFGGAHLTDFTKRKNWPLRVLSELKDFLHVVSPSGRFLFCSPSCQEMVGFMPEELVGRSITDFIHIDDIDTFIRDFNLAINQKQFRLFYRFRKKDDKFVVLEVNGHPYFSDNSSTARCFFIMARPYPSKAASMIDSFLELRMENEILARRLQELRREADLHTNGNTTTNTNNNLNNNATASISGNSNNSLNTQTESTNSININLPNRHFNPTNSSDVSTPIPTKLSNENHIPVDIQPEMDTNKAKKKLKKNKEKEIHVCTDCGTIDSPEWRKGPQGPKTLCNACGLRYAKKSRKPNLANEPDFQAMEE